jgi:hypothetical protein
MNLIEAIVVLMLGFVILKISIERIAANNRRKALAKRNARDIADYVQRKIEEKKWLN